MPVTILGYSILKFANLDDTFSEFFKLKANPVEGQSLQQNEKEKKERCKNKMKENEKPKDIGHFLVQNLEILISAYIW